VAALEALQAGIEPALLLIEQAVEQGDGRPQWLRLWILGWALGLPRRPLCLMSTPLRRAVEIERPQPLAV
jgi:hypothetical protein